MNASQNTHGNAADLLAQLHQLEYAIRRSIVVREDQEDAASDEHIGAAHGLGIRVDTDASKGDLLAAVQTRLRAVQAKSV